MIAYLLPGATASQGQAAIHKRLAPVGPWSLVSAAGNGAFVFWHGAPASPSGYGEPRQTFDGLTYFPPKAPPTLAELLRPSHPEGVAVALGCGQDALIPLATRSPVRRRFGGADRLGSHAGAFAEAAFALYDRVQAKDDIKNNDAGYALALFLAIQSCYRVTEELLDDLGAFTTADDAAILAAMFGSDPKA